MKEKRCGSRWSEACDTKHAAIPPPTTLVVFLEDKGKMEGKSLKIDDNQSICSGDLTVVVSNVDPNRNTVQALTTRITELPVRLKNKMKNKSSNVAMDSADRPERKFLLSLI